MSRRTAKILQFGDLVITFILMRILSESAIAATIIGLIGIGIVIWLNYFLRCPNCGAWPGIGRHLMSKYCPHCGEYLGD